MRRTALFSLALIAVLPAIESTSGQQPSGRPAETPNSVAPTEVDPSAYPSPSQPTPGAAPSENDYDAERARIWNSREMVEARQYVIAYSRRSVQFSPRQAQAYLARLEKLSPSEMKEWLKRFNARRAQIAQGTAVEKKARQQSVSQALDRITTARQAYNNISQGQSQAAETARSRVQASQDLAGQALFAKLSARGATLQDVFAQRFNPFDPTLDPAAGSYYQRRAGAAATLPGDLVDANGNNIVGTDADIAAATPEGAAGYAGGNVPGGGSPSPPAESGAPGGAGSP